MLDEVLDSEIDKAKKLCIAYSLTASDLINRLTIEYGDEHAAYPDDPRSESRARAHAHKVLRAAFGRGALHVGKFGRLEIGGQQTSAQATPQYHMHNGDPHEDT